MIAILTENYAGKWWDVAQTQTLIWLPKYTLHNDSDTAKINVMEARLEVDGNVGTSVKTWLYLPSFHQAAVALPPSGDVSSCQPLLWRIRQEGKCSSPFFRFFRIVRLNISAGFFIHTFIFHFILPFRFVNSLQKLVSWQMPTLTLAACWTRKSVMLSWLSITSSLVRSCYLSSPITVLLLA